MQSQPKRRARSGMIAFNTGLKSGFSYGKGQVGQTYGQSRRPYDLKKYGGRPKITRALLNQMYGDNSIAMTYVDKVDCKGTTGQAAVQSMWANRVSYGGAISAATQAYLAPNFNLVVHDPVILNRYCNLLTTPAGNASAKTTKMFVKQYKTSACLTNCENGPIEIWEYRLIARTRITLSGWNTILNTLNDPATAPSGAAGGNLTNPGSFTVPQVTVTFPFATTTQTQLGITPYMIPGLTRYFKISGPPTKQVLAPNERWCISYKCRKPMIYDNEKFNLSVAPDPSGSSTNPTLWAGMGISLFIMKGTFGVDSVGTAAQQFGIGNASVGIEYRVSFHYSLIAQNYMSTGLVRDAPGFTVEESGYPAPIVRTWNLNAISTGPTPAAAGTNVPNSIGGALAVPDNIQADEL